MTSLELLSLLAPEHDAVAEARRTSMLEHVATLMDAAAWGGLFQTAAVRLAAHELSRDSTVNGAVGAGPVLSVKAGKQAVTYGAVATSSGRMADLSTTRHGLAYIGLLEQIGVGSFAAVVT